MSVLLADIDATCAALGYFDGDKYHAEPDAIQGLKHLIWILRRDIDNHEYRRHLGRAKVLQTDLVPMLPDYIENEDYCDVLIRLLVVLTNPSLLLYRNGLPKDGPGRKIYLELVDILQGYKEAFTSDYCWATLTTKLHKVLGVDWAVRSEEEGLLIERILVLVRNVLQVPANPEAECRADNDASLHDQVIWALHQSGMLDLVLYILSSANENQYHLHALEIVCLMYREQSAPSLSDASLQRSAAEKHRDEQELVAVRRREKQKLIARPPPGRHSRFGGTYVLQNVKSVSDKDIICHQSLERAMAVDFDREKVKQKRSHRFVKEENAFERRSAFSVRLCLREYCIEVLRSAYNTLVRQVRRVLERNSGSASHDDSYLLWAIRFFMEFNRLSGLQLHLVSESLSVQCFHWVLTRIQNAMDMITCDKTQSRLWARRLHVTVQTFRELLLSLLALKTLRDEKAQALFDMLLNNVCYVLEYRETILHLLMNYNESHSTKAYLRDVVETANIFIKMMEKFCQDSVVVQDKRRQRKKTTKSRTKQMNAENENLEDIWAVLASEVSSALTKDITLSEEQHPVPFDAAAEKSIDDQKEDCMLRIHKFLREEKIEHAIILMRSAREVWPENDCFGAISSAPEDELMLLREIFLSNLGSVEKAANEAQDNAGNEDRDDEEDEDDEEEEPELVEKDFRFEDFAKRLINPRIVRACTVVLSDWEKIPTKCLKSAVTILYRIAFGCKCPAMLYQAILFKIFKQVFNAPKDPHHEELRRLGVYVVRKFVEIAPTNPKIYAELLFYKTLREANDLETGYDTSSGVVKGAWTEEQENELQLLFEENQRNPQTDQDVIDWILDNLIDKTRTRRGVLKKLKELGLVFKKPTKKATAAAANKNLWQNEDDDRLRNLYDEHRLQEDCLDRIMEAMGGNWSKNQVIKRMIQIHLIADRSEIVPKKGKKRQSKKSQVRNTSPDDDDDDDMQDEDRQLSTRKAPSLTRKKQTKKLVKTPLDVKVVKSLLNQIDDKFQAVIDWLKNSLTEAAEDIEEPSDDPEDGVPLLPLQDLEREAMDDAQFKKLLISMGIQPPISEMESYWRIPVYLTAADLQMRLDVLNGTYEEPAKTVENEDSEEQNYQDEGETEQNNEMSYEEYMQEKRRQRLDSLVFNKSDDDDEHRTPLRPKPKNKSMAKKTKNSKEKNQKEKVGKVNIRDMIKDAESDDKLSILDFDSEQGLRQRLAELSESDNSEKENDSADPSILVRKRIRTNIIDSDSSDDETEMSQTKTNQSRTDNAEVNFNQELTGMVDQSINLKESTADEGNADIQPLLETNGKRTRSEDDDDMSDEGLQVKRRKSKDSTARRRKVAIIEDDDD